MTILFFEGPAGSGKTTALIEELKRYLTEYSLLDGQVILGLTMMHGARRRLSEKLNREIELQSKFQCSTFDSFAWKLVNRWKGLVDHMQLPFPNSYDETCNVASTLLENDLVNKWVSRTYPIILVDEAQDCKKGRLGIIKQLNRHCTLFIAADEFQDLNDTKRSESVVWLKQIVTPISLVNNYRTNQHSLLKVAQSLRNGEGVESLKGCYIHEVPTHHIAIHLCGYFLLNNKRKEIAILSPTKPSNAKFVENIVNKLKMGGTKLKNSSTPLKPINIKWEEDIKELEDKLKNVLPNDLNMLIKASDLVIDESILGARQLKEWMYNRESLTGIKEISVTKLIERIPMICHQIKSFGTYHNSTVRAMTIHQAKNQEFDCVIILWPYNVRSDDEVNRRLLYNAVTRAKESCMIIVQGNPGKSRLKKAPFNVE